MKFKIKYQQILILVLKRRPLYIASLVWLTSPKLSYKTSVVGWRKRPGVFRHKDNEATFRETSVRFTHKNDFKK